MNEVRAGEGNSWNAAPPCRRRRRWEGAGPEGEPAGCWALPRVRCRLAVRAVCWGQLVASFAARSPGHVWAVVLCSSASALSLACISGPRKGLPIKCPTVKPMKRSGLICETSHAVLERGNFLREPAVILSLFCLARCTSWFWICEMYILYCPAPVLPTRYIQAACVLMAECKNPI